MLVRAAGLYPVDGKIAAIPAVAERYGIATIAAGPTPPGGAVPTGGLDADPSALGAGPTQTGVRTAAKVVRRRSANPSRS